MRRYWLVLLLFVSIATPMRAQKMAEDYFQEAEYAANIGNTSAALNHFTYLVQHYPASKFCRGAYSALGNIYASTGQYQMAINAFRGVIFDRYGQLPNKDTMLPWFNEQPMATKQLIDLYEKTGNYDSAIYFVYLYDSAFSIFYGCGNMGWGELDAIPLKCADLNLKANRIRDAEKALLSMHEFECGNYNNPEGCPVLEQLKELFTKYENANTLNALIETAIDNYSVDTTFSRDKDPKYTRLYVCLSFLGTKVRYPFSPEVLLDDSPLSDGTAMVGLSERERLTTRLRRSKLYDLVRHL